MQLENKQPLKNNHDNWIEKKKKKKTDKQTNKQTKMIKNKPKTRIKANQHHNQLGLSKAKQSNKLWQCDLVKCLWKLFDTTNTEKWKKKKHLQTAK